MAMVTDANDPNLFLLVHGDVLEFNLRAEASGPRT